MISPSLSCMSDDAALEDTLRRYSCSIFVSYGMKADLLDADEFYYSSTYFGKLPGCPCRGGRNPCPFSFLTGLWKKGDRLPFEQI